MWTPWPGPAATRSTPTARGGPARPWTAGGRPATGGMSYSTLASTSISTSASSPARIDAVPSYRLALGPRPPPRRRERMTLCPGAGQSCPRARLEGGDLGRGGRHGRHGQAGCTGPLGASVTPLDRLSPLTVAEGGRVSRLPRFVRGNGRHSDRFHGQNRGTALGHHHCESQIGGWAGIKGPRRGRSAAELALDPVQPPIRLDRGRLGQPPHRPHFACVRRLRSLFAFPPFPPVGLHALASRVLTDRMAPDQPPSLGHQATAIRLAIYGSTLRDCWRPGGG
jgi:hypothetical protein